MSDVFHLVIPVVRQRGDDRGEAAAGWYRVVGNEVILTDEEGEPLGDRRTTIGEGDNPRVLAARMLKRKWEAQKPNDFFRPLGHHDYETWRY